MAELRTTTILATLVTRGVDFVVIGGMAAVLHGSPRMTQDVDVCFAGDDGNLQALGRALADLHAKLAGVSDDVPFVPDERTLRGIEVLTLETDAGRLDLLARPDGAPPYGELRARAERVDIGPCAVLVSSIEDLRAMKRAAGRPRDLADLAELEAIERLRRRGS